MMVECPDCEGTGRIAERPWTRGPFGMEQHPANEVDFPCARCGEEGVIEEAEEAP